MGKITEDSSLKEFYLTTNEFCKLVEYTGETGKIEFISKSQKLLSFVYLKASLLRVPSEMMEGEIEKFVQEEDWIYVKKNVTNVLGTNDIFINVVLPEEIETETYEEISISESFADIYQDLKDFVVSFEIGNDEGIKATLYECLLNFEKFWGPRLLAVLSVLHNFLYNSDISEENGENSKNNPDDDIDTSNWLINQRFNN